MKTFTITICLLAVSAFAFGQHFTNTVQGGFNSMAMTGGGNSIYGVYAGSKLTSGELNTFIGLYSGNGATTGKDNTFVGSYSGQKNTTGSKNTFMGIFAGYKNTTGDANVLIGDAAGYNNNGYSNIFIGQNAGKLMSSGNENVFIGRGSGWNNKGGSNNVYIGKASGLSAPGSGNVFIGAAAGYSEKGSNKLVIANSNTATPLIYGDFSGAALTVNGAFTVTGEASKAGGGSWSVASDKRLKKDVRPFTDGLEVLQKIKPVRFRYNGKADMPTDKEYVGIIAQEMQKTAPYTVDTFTHKGKDGSQTEYLEYDSSALDYIIVNAIKAQQEIIEAQQKEIAGLKEMVYGLVSASKKEQETGTLHASANGEE